MTEEQRRRQLNRIRARFARLYGHDAAPDCLARLKLLLGQYEGELSLPTRVGAWDQGDSVLIAYGDTVQQDGEPPLRTLGRFLAERLDGVVSTVHILPFFPYSSDDGFSVIHYRKVNEDLGTWSDIQSVGSRFDLMFDLVLNHCSKHSGWFDNYLRGIAPYRDYFLDVEPFTDLSQVVRPRVSPLLTAVQTRSGERWVWTTFSNDQVDLNFANPDVLLEMLDVLLLYIQRGARILRLDAIAYLWKEIGTTCIHMPQTHEVVKLMRDVVDLVAPSVLLLTETNVPHDQNVSYFGKQDEAHMVYNFSLPPLLLHAVQTGSARHLTRWAKSLAPPPKGCTYLNFTASHDGVGVRPLEGILDTRSTRTLAAGVEELGGYVSYKADAGGTRSPYELNTTWFDAMRLARPADVDLQIDCCLCSQAVALALQGVPAVYFHALVAAANDRAAVDQQGHARAINRHKWKLDELDQWLADASSPQARVLEGCRRLLRLRGAQPAFHPDGPQQILSLHDRIFALHRQAPPGGDQALLCLHNLSGTDVSCKLPARLRNSWTTSRDLVTDDVVRCEEGVLRLQPYQFQWLIPVDTAS